jgi:phosphatidylglycerol lysyltransferase
LKKALLIIIAIVACCFLLANADYLMEFVDTLATGALVPIIVACVFMLFERSQNDNEPHRCTHLH